jgi:hypothetical protein
MKIVNTYFENVATFKYLGMTTVTKNLAQEEIKEEIEFELCLLPFSSESCIFAAVV